MRQIGAWRITGFTLAQAMHGGVSMLFRQLFDADTSSYTYLLADEPSRAAVIIDPVFEQFARDRDLIAELELELKYTLDTHVHADHVTASGLLRAATGARSVISERAGAACADLQVKQGDVLRFGRHTLEVRETPGHTAGCLTFVCPEANAAFTGDALLIRGCGRTDFQQGSAADLYRSVQQQIFSLPDDTLLYPAHDYKGRTVTSVREERRLNPRLGGGKTEQEFTQIMHALQLPYPRKLDVALPSNLRCGVPQPAAEQAAALDTGWANIVVTPAGVPEVTPDWLAIDPSRALVIDVREPDEYRGELGHIPGAVLAPLHTLSGAELPWSRQDPIIAVCRSGGRSGKAAFVLAERGFRRVASLQGGMRTWNAKGLPVAYGSEAQHAQSRQG